MKYILFVTLLLSCTPNGNESTREDGNTQPLYDYRIVVIDGCEYIEIYFESVSNSRYSLTHKGDCHNHIHPEHTRR